MEIEFDPVKNTRNIKKHGIALELAVEFDFTSAVVIPDLRRDYGEDRFIATGLMGGRVYVLIFTPRRSAFRIISLRKANAREGSVYEEEQG